MPYCSKCGSHLNQKPSDVAGKAVFYKSMPHSDAPTITVKADGKHGSLEGYAAIFGNVDSQGETIRKGAFAKTIRERIPAGKVKLMIVHFCHGGGTSECIGTVTEAKEDDKGLWIHADLSSDETAQQARTKAQEGHVTGLSVGYRKVREAPAMVDGKSVNELQELMLLEVTLTPFPSNEETGVTGAKDAPASQPDTAIVSPPPTVDRRSIARRRKLALATLLMEDGDDGQAHSGCTEGTG